MSITFQGISGRVLKW